MRYLEAEKDLVFKNFNLAMDEIESGLKEDNSWLHSLSDHSFSRDFLSLEKRKNQHDYNEVVASIKNIDIYNIKIRYLKQLRKLLEWKKEF